MGITRQTLYNWQRTGKIIFVKSLGGHNFVTEETYNKLLGNKNKLNKTFDI